MPSCGRLPIGRGFTICPTKCALIVNQLWNHHTSSAPSTPDSPQQGPASPRIYTLMRHHKRRMDNKQPEQPEPWMRGIVHGIDTVIGHLLRAAEQIHEDAATAISDLTRAQLWSKSHRMTSAGFHAKHLAGSTERLSTYLAGKQLTAGQLAAIAKEGERRKPPRNCSLRLTPHSTATANCYKPSARTILPQSAKSDASVTRPPRSPLRSTSPNTHSVTSEA